MDKSNFHQLWDAAASYTAKIKMAFFKILAPTIGGRSIGKTNAKTIDFCPQVIYYFKYYER